MEPTITLQVLLLKKKPGLAATTCRQHNTHNMGGKIRGEGQGGRKAGGRKEGGQEGRGAGRQGAGRRGGGDEGAV